MRRRGGGLLCLGLLAGAGLACRAREEARPSPTPPAAAVEARRFPLKGVITAVDLERFRITIAHEEIPGHLPAGTTAFGTHDDRRVVEILRPGDRIEATLVVEPSHSHLEEILTKGFVPTPAPGAER